MCILEKQSFSFNLNIVFYNGVYVINLFIVYFFKRVICQRI